MLLDFIFHFLKKLPIDFQTEAHVTQVESLQRDKIKMEG